MLLSTQALALSNRAADAVRSGEPEGADGIILRLVTMALMCNSALSPFDFPDLHAEAS